jgi:4-hydroxy-tetrahydrodipicolinate synthase
MFHGSIVALVTPMDERGRIDFAAVQRLVSFHLEAGTNALVVAGTTGESAMLSIDEFASLVEAVVGAASGRIPVLAGTGTASTAATVERTRLAAELGVDGVLVVTPYYVRPMQSGLAAHYEAVADASRVPVVLYNVPSRTAADLQPETVEALARREEIVAIKEAVPDMGRIRALVERCGSHASVLSGDDPTCLAAMREGARGVVSVAANAAPAVFAELCAAAGQGDWTAAETVFSRLGELIEALAVETNPIPVKWALYRLGLIGPGIRLPLLPLAEGRRGSVEAAMASLPPVPDIDE